MKKCRENKKAEIDKMKNELAALAEKNPYLEGKISSQQNELERMIEQVELNRKVLTSQQLSELNAIKEDLRRTKNETSMSSSTSF